MKKNTRVLSVSLLVPLVIMILISIAMLLLARGRERKLREQEVTLLEPLAVPEFQGGIENSTCLICYDGEKIESVNLAENAADVLTRLHVYYTKLDLQNEEPDFSTCEELLLCTGDLAAFSETSFPLFAEWMDRGDLIMLTLPEHNGHFRMVYRKLGISDTNWEYLSGIRELLFEDDFIPGLKGKAFRDMGMDDVCLSLQVESDCSIHVRDTETGVPLIWSRKLADTGSVTVFNNTLVNNAYNFTGLIAAAYVESKSVYAWPIINSKAIFIDDFPAPQPEGYDERLMKQFGYDTKSFFRNIWWPDMKNLAERHELLYTGVLIEDYNENMTPPFSAGYADSLLQYYGAELLNTGGEIALHGYNHQPLIPEGYPTEDNYKGWPSKENMAASLQELNRYAQKLFPEISYNVYVPPSNNLSSEGYQVLKENEKTLSVVSGVYYDEENGTNYRTDFTETEDGIVQIPRIGSGFSMNAQSRLRSYCMLYMQGVFSHFVHPDDVLDVDRGAELGWKKLLEDFENDLTDIDNTYSCLRGLTASSTAGAVQRCNRAMVSMENTGSETDIQIRNFTDEVWLALSCHNRTPKETAGAELFKINDGLYWLHCTKSNVQIQWDN